MQMALPKGRLLADLLPVLSQAGYEFSFTTDRDYRPVSNHPTVQAKLFKVRAIPQILSVGLKEVGFCGMDLLRESMYDNVLPLYDLGLNPVELVVAVPKDRVHMLSDPPKRPLIIASEYEHIASEWAYARNLANTFIQTWGSTEAYAPEDADIVFDCCETGRTIEANGLVIIERLFKSSTWLVASRLAMETPEIQSQIQMLIEQLKKGRANSNG